MPRDRRPTMAVWKFASCDGCQLSLLNGEDELLALADRVTIAHFLEASRATVQGPYHLSLVEGSVSTPEDVVRIRQLRRRSRFLVAMGACATAGGIQALRNFASLEAFVPSVYGRPDYIRSLETSTPISEHVKVDFELRGCPVDRAQLFQTIRAFLEGRPPAIRRHAVCLECKRRGAVCVTVVRRVPCLGPVTHAGCGAICPAVGRGCYACFGPADTTNTASLSARLGQDGASDAEIVRAFRSFNAGAEAFRLESEAHGSK